MKYEDRHKYDDIINLPHHVSARHPQMALLDRAAQFSPFAALTGHDAAIRETARLTDMYVEPGEDSKMFLDEQLRMIKENLSQKPEIKATYFRPDLKKSGGACVTVHGRVKKIDEYSRQMFFEDGVILPMENLLSIEGELFKE